MTKTSINVQELRRRIAIKAKTDAKHRFWGLFCHITKVETLMEAYRMAKANRGSAGSDGVTFKDVELTGVLDLIETLSRELREGTYQPLPLRIVKIPKDDGGERVLKIAAIRDRIVQGALKLILEPIFEMDFQPGSFGYRPRRTANQARKHLLRGLYHRLHDVIDLDLKSYFDTVRHDLLLNKIGKRVDDDLVMKLCRQVLKTGGKKGLAQGSIVGPLFSNLFLNDLDKVLEKAQDVTRSGRYETIRYARFADDLVVLVSCSPYRRKANLLGKLQLRIEEELSKLDLEINREKTKIVDLTKGDSFKFLGFDFRLTPPKPGKNHPGVIERPSRAKRVAFLRKIRSTLKRNRFRPVEEVVRKELNPQIRGWVEYFRHGNSGKDLKFVKSAIEIKVRKFATRQTHKKRGGRSWTKWSRAEIYGKWGLYSNYQVAAGSAFSGKVT